MPPRSFFCMLGGKKKNPEPKFRIPGGRYRTRTVPAGNEAVEQRPRKALLRPAGRFGVCVVEWC